jgi:hypothetical protein
MKKINVLVVILAFTFLFVNIGTAQDYPQVIEHQTLYNYISDTKYEVLYQEKIDSIWVDESLKELTLDSRGNILEQINKSWNGTDWKDTIRIVSTYDIQNRQITVEDFLNSGTCWYSNFKDSITYNYNGLIEMKWQWRSDTLYSTELNDYTYNDSNRIESATTKYLRNNEWNDAYKVNYQFENNTLLMAEFYFRKDKDLWDTTGKLLYQYDDKKQIIHKIQWAMFYNYKDSSWWSTVGYFWYNYNDLGLLVEYRQDGLSMEKFIQTNIYNEFNNLTKTIKIIDPLVLGTVDTLITEYYYDNEQKLIRIHEKFVLNTEGLPVKDDIFREFISIISPNPFKTYFEIKLTLQKPEIVGLKIADFQGQVLYTLNQGFQDTGENKIRYNASELAPGIYLYILQIGKRIESGKLIRID